MNLTKDRLPLVLLLLRLGVFFVVTLWTMSKFLHPTQAVSIYAGYYGLRLNRTAVYILGTLEFVLAMAFLTGIQKRFSRALVMAVVAATAMSPGRLYLHPYMDHILLFFAFWTTLAGCFALYSLRDYDMLWTLRSAPELPVSGAERNKRLALALLLLRISVAVAVGMWCVGKFINPTQTTRILSTFYSIRGVSFAAAYGIGILQALLVAMFLLGVVKRISYGLVLISHSLGVMAPGLQYLHPYQGHVLLFLGAIPMWSVCFALYYLRDDDVLFVLSSQQKNSDSHTREKSAETNAGQHLTGSVRNSTFIVIAGSLALVLFLARVSVKNADLERRRGPAIIAFVQQQFAPSPKLLAMHPTEIG